MKGPDFFIVGAPKCGTTAMYEYLKAHPEIYMSPAKEPYFFGSDLRYLQFHRPTRDEYLSLFSGAKDEKRLGEASVTYLVSCEAAQEIKAFNSNAQIIIMLRNPIDMMYSMHSQALFTRVENIQDFATALSLEEARKQGYNIPPHTTILSFILYRELARYSSQVERYFQVFGRNQVHVIVYDDFKKDVAAAYRQTLQFLCVNEQFQPRSFNMINVNKRRRNEWFISALNNKYVVKGVRLLLPRHSVRQYIAKKLTFMTVDQTPRSAMSSNLRRVLQSEFLPEIEQLSSLLGRDLTHWCRDETSSTLWEIGDENTTGRTRISAS